MTGPGQPRAARTPPALPPAVTLLGRRLVRWVAVPAAVYLAGFALFTWPWLRQWRSAFWCDNVDGYLMVWNLWWMGTAVHALRSPWFTPVLHWPSGTTLLGHSLVPFNGLLATVGTSAGLSPVTAHNLIIGGSFVATGVTACWLAAEASGSYAGGLVAGFAFTFSEYHLSHAAAGHMDLVSVEWVPLFLLLWSRLLDRPSAARAVGAALVLWLVLLCDYYYFGFAIAAAGVRLAWQAAGDVRRRARSRRGPWVNWRLFRALVPFAVVTLATCGPILVPFLGLDLIGSHAAALGSADLLAPLVPGDEWWARRLTRPYWSQLHGYPHEGTVYLGLSVIALVVLGLVGRRPVRWRWYWAGLAAGSFVLSLGPALQVCGRTVTGRWLPYAALEWASPTVRLSGVPVRLMVMATLAVAVLAAAGVPVVMARFGRLGGPLLLAVVLCLDLWPTPLPVAPVAVPPWVLALRDLPDPAAAVLDLSRTLPGPSMYDQTIHHRPMAFGYISRLPVPVNEQDQRLIATLMAGNWSAVRYTFRFRYVVMPADGRVPGALLVYAGPDRRIFDLGSADR